MNPTITFTVTADTLEEAAQFAIDRLKNITTTDGHRGFLLPELTAEMILHRDGEWIRAYEFTTELLPQGAPAKPQG